MNDKLKVAISNIEKKFGKGAVISMTGDVDYSIQRVPSGSLALDIALGGGWPYSRIVEIYGPESSGKSTVLLHAIREVQRQGKTAAYLDAECSFDPIYAENLGIDLSPEKFIFCQPSCGEEAFSIAEELLKSNEVAFIGIDSVAALTPKAEIEGEMGESKMGLQARLMSQGMRKLTSLVKNSQSILFFTNQLRDQIGVIYGNPETTPGGNALKFYASIRCDIRRKQILKDGDNQAYSNEVKVKVIKNKTAPPFRECLFTIEYGVGISKYSEVLDLSVQNELIKKSGSWYSLDDKKIGQGREMTIEYLRNNPEVFEDLVEKIRTLYSLF